MSRNLVIEVRLLRLPIDLDPTKCYKPNTRTEDLGDLPYSLVGHDGHPAYCIVSHLGGGRSGALWRRWLVHSRYSIVKNGTEAPNVT